MINRHAYDVVHKLEKATLGFVKPLMYAYFQACSPKSDSCNISQFIHKHKDQLFTAGKHFKPYLSESIAPKRALIEEIALTAESVITQAQKLYTPLPWHMCHNKGQLSDEQLYERENQVQSLEHTASRLLLLTTTFIMVYDIPYNSTIMLENPLMKMALSTPSSVEATQYHLRKVQKQVASVFLLSILAKAWETEVLSATSFGLGINNPFVIESATNTSHLESIVSICSKVVDYSNEYEVLSDNTRSYKLDLASITEPLSVYQMLHRPEQETLRASFKEMIEDIKDVEKGTGLLLMRDYYANAYQTLKAHPFSTRSMLEHLRTIVEPILLDYEVSLSPLNEIDTRFVE